MDEVKEYTQVRKEVKDMGDLVSELEANVSCLETRLANVRWPQPPTGEVAKDETPPSSLCPLALELHEVNERIRSLDAKIIRLNNSLQN